MSIIKWGRFFAVYDENKNLVCICVYKKGAKEVIRRLETTRNAIAKAEGRF